MKNQLLLNAVNQFGSPLYVYDSNKIKFQYNRLTESFKNIKNLQINYAVKASSNISILKYLINLGAGIDAVSVQEVELAIKAGVDPKKIIYTPNGVSLEEIEKVSKKGAKINIDNLAVLEEFGNKHKNIPICIRINPHIMAGGNSKISVGHIDSKFGISIHQAPHIHRIVKNTNLKIN
jgi:diaminopimelate decarboxylase